MHSQGVIHGNLQGVRFRTCSCRSTRRLPGTKENILIDSKGRACLTGFSLLTVVSDQSTITPPDVAGGAVRWMSPELFDPKKFGLKECRPTKASDCYALGMVVYEVLSGRTPYAMHNPLVVAQRILSGERPGRPRGAQDARFTTELWEVLQLCWKAHPSDRPDLGVVLRCLEDAVGVPRPPPGVDVDVEMDVDDLLDAVASTFRSSTSGSPLISLTAHTGLPIARGRGVLPVPPQMDSPEEGRIGGKLARGARRVLKVVN